MRVGVVEKGGVAEVHRRVQVHVRPGRNLVARQDLEKVVSQGGGIGSSSGDNNSGL